MECCTLLERLVGLAIRYADDDVRRRALGDMVRRLVEETDLRQSIRRAAGLAVGHLRAALLGVEAMLSHENWGQLIVDGAGLSRGDWHHRFEVLRELYGAVYEIPRAIYSPASPALRGYPRPVYHFSG